ncbi:MAG: hypothetical protein Q8919_06575 [Bacteroidota bacterium]|nr:hypothetical protein [Bacteroidota bacterium]
MHKAFAYSWIIHCSTIVTSLMSTWIIFSGMEVTLTIPLYLLLILKVQEFSDGVLTKKHVFVFGFLASLVILSRLDAIIDISFFTTYLFISSRGSIRQKLKLLPYLFIAGSLLLLYFASNYVLFGSFATISAQAKQLKSTGGIGFSVLGELRSSRNSFISVWIFPPAVILHTIFKTVFGHCKRLLLMLTLLVPFIHLIIFRTFSDWYLFAWYTYAFHIGNGIALASILFLISRKIPRRFTSSLGYISVLAVSLMILVPVFKRTVEETVSWNPHPGSIYAHARKIKAFTDSHPGIYAMGDRAGLTAYITHKSMVQIEGIMADRRMIKHIAAEDNLCEVLKEYNVDYVIFSTYTPMPQNNCTYSIEVPFEMQSGVKSKKMKGSFSEKPVFYYESPNDPRMPVVIYTYIFKISYVIGHVAPEV